MDVTGTTNVSNLTKFDNNTNTEHFQNPRSKRHLNDFTMQFGVQKATAVPILTSGKKKRKYVK